MKVLFRELNILNQLLIMILIIKSKISKNLKFSNIIYKNRLFTCLVCGSGVEGKRRGAGL